MSGEQVVRSTDPYPTKITPQWPSAEEVLEAEALRDLEAQERRELEEQMKRDYYGTWYGA